jgi:glyoxylase I family protein
MQADSQLLERPAHAVQELRERRERRRSANRIKRLHHHALRTNDMEATRHFYEDILGMPMVSTLIEMVDPTRGTETPYLHCFFEMGDGSSIAFFEFANGVRGDAPKTPQDALDHHFAVSVPSFDDIKALKEKLEAAGHRCAGIDHDFCYSLYVRDPNGMLMEFVADPENELEVNEGYAEAAHEELERWNRGEYAAEEKGRKTAEYPIPMSPLDEILKVLPDDRDNR